MRGRGNKNQDKNEDKDRRSNNHCWLQKEECVRMLKKTIMEDKSEVDEVNCYDKRINRFAHISGSSGNGDIKNMLLSKFNSGMIVSGQSTFMLDSAYYDNEVGSLIVPGLNGAVYGEDAGPCRRLVETTGTKDMVAIRITASDQSTTASDSSIRDSWFGTNKDPVNLKSQYEACSYNKLMVNAANNETV